MIESVSLRSLYKPVQPSVKQLNNRVLYRELCPNGNLMEEIYCYWELKTAAPLKEDYMYRVVADGCIDIFFDLQHSENSFVMGFCKSFVEFPIGKEFHYVGIRFLPSIFPSYYNIDASTLTNRYEALCELHPHFAHFIKTTFSSTDSFEEIKSHLDTHLSNDLNGPPLKKDARFEEALRVILQKKGIMNIEEDLNVGLSPRQLRRIFKFFIGDSAKSFSKVVRFQCILNAKPSRQSLKESKLFYDGFFDQAHFIKDFKQFYGLTPSKAFR